MAVNHRVMRIVFAFAIGLAVAFGSYRWITNPERAAERKVEEAVVLEARNVLRDHISTSQELKISDPLDRIREAGKVYIFPVQGGWEVSGHYQRVSENRWHSFLMKLDRNTSLISLAVQDSNPELAERADVDTRLSVTPDG